MRHRVADLLNRILGGGLTVFSIHRDGVLDLTWLALLSNLGFTRLQLRIRANFNLKRSGLRPLNLRGRRFALGAHLDDLVHRLSHTLSLGVRTRDLRVHDGLGRSHLVLARLAFLNSFLFAGLKGVIEDDLGLKRHVHLRLSGVSALSLRAHTNLSRNRLLRALRRHGRLAVRLTVLDLLSRRHNLCAKLALLIDDLLAGLKGVIKDDLRLEQNRLLGLGHHLGVLNLSLRAVLDDAVLRFEARGNTRHLRFTIDTGKGSFVGLLAVGAFLDNLCLTRRELRVRAQDGAKRNWHRPRHLVRRSRLLGTHLDHLINRLLNDLLRDLRITRLRVGDIARNGHLLLARLTFLGHLGLTSRHLRIKLDLHTEWNLSLNSLGVRTGGLGAHADDLLDRFLGALGSHLRITRRLTVDDLLGRRHNLSTVLALLINLLLTSGKRVIKDNLRLKRNRLLSLGHHRGVISLRAILNDLVDRILRLLLLRGHRCLVTGGGEISGVGLFTRNTLLNNLDLTRLEFRIRAGLYLKRNLSSPRDLRGSLRRLRTHLDHLINRLFGDLLGDLRVTRLGVGDVALDRHRLLTRNTRRGHLGGASRHIRIELDLHTERDLRLNGLSVRTRGLGTHADDSVLLLGHRCRLNDGVAGGFAVDKLLRACHLLLADDTLLIDDLLTRGQRVIEDDRGLKRDLARGLRDQLLIL